MLPPLPLPVLPPPQVLLPMRLPVRLLLPLLLPLLPPVRLLALTTDTATAAGAATAASATDAGPGTAAAVTSAATATPAAAITKAERHVTGANNLPVLGCPSCPTG